MLKLCCKIIKICQISCHAVQLCVARMERHDFMARRFSRLHRPLRGVGGKNLLKQRKRTLLNPQKLLDEIRVFEAGRLR